MEEIVEMIDLHSHILYGLDDGAETLEESIQMCRISVRDGIRTIVATPHILPGIYPNDRFTILTKLQELNEAIRMLGVRSWEFGVNAKILRPKVLSDAKNRADPKNQIDEMNLKVLPGADVHFSTDLLQRYERGEIVTVNDQGRYLMVEFPFHGIPYRAEEVLFQLMAKGIIPIISHPERNFEIGERPQRYYEMIRRGCLGQVTGMSLTGEFGPVIRRIAEKLLTHRLIHFIGSDAHSMNGRQPILSSAVRAAEKILGGKEARRMVTEYPQAVLEGRRPDIPKPIPPD